MSNKTIARETTIEVGSKTYRLARFDREILENFLDWADETLPNPIAALKDQLKGLDAETKELVVKAAVEKASSRRCITNPDVQSLMRSFDGIYHLFYLLLQKHQPNITEQEAGKLYEACVEEHGPKYIERKMSIITGEVPQAESDVERQVMVEAGVLEKKAMML
jgi:hypothetical protein